MVLVVQEVVQAEEATPSIVKEEKEDRQGQVGSRNRVVVAALSSRLADGAAIEAAPRLHLLP